MKKNKVKFKQVIASFILISLILLETGCSTTRAIKNRYQKNRKGNYDITGELKEITYAIGEDIVKLFRLPGKSVSYLGKGLEKTGQFLQGEK